MNKPSLAHLHFLPTNFSLSLLSSPPLQHGALAISVSDWNNLVRRR
uniref:Uncharacterized protein n=1 Tax=Nelumbo nucifera TaxID=4432 RepID=A0A822Z922_NELNU|nr:TPA_asm: hypothetical protein HUJ06_014544 [Nelumbo nucifera]